MRIVRRAAVLMVLLGLSLGTPGIFAAPARSQASHPARAAVWSAVQLFEAVRSRLAGWMKEGPGADPWGTKEGPGIDPWGTKAGPGIDPLGNPQGGSTNGAQSQNLDAGCEIDPLGRCASGH